MERGMSYAPVTVGRLPLGVAVLAVLIGIFGFFIFALGLIVLIAGVGIGLAGGATVFGVSGLLAGLIILIIGGIILAVAFGLWDQELWALALAIIVLGILGAVEFFSGSWLAFLVAVLLLVYLVVVSNHFA
jgi:hypothetical protein